jgi:hypothetical protein
MALSIEARAGQDTQLRRLAAAVFVAATALIAIVLAAQFLPQAAGTSTATVDAPTYVGVVHAADEAAAPATVYTPTYLGVVHAADEAASPAGASRLDGVHEWARMISEQGLLIGTLQGRFDSGMRTWALQITSQQGPAGSAHPLDAFRGR